MKSYDCLNLGIAYGYKWILIILNIREHSLSCDHPIISDKFSVLAKCPTFDLRLLESI